MNKRTIILAAVLNKCFRKPAALERVAGCQIFCVMIAGALFVMPLAFSAQNQKMDTRPQQLDSLFSNLFDTKKFTGNVLIAENGKPVFQKSYGLAFREKNEMLNDSSIFELASLGKQFTAMGIMILKKQGKLKYTDTLRQFFPQLPYHNITIRHLLNHTSGLPDYLELGMKVWDSTKIMTNKDMIAMLAQQKPPVLFAPGEEWQYSNTGYALLGSIIEKVSGKPFRYFMKEYIYQPLQMNHTLVYHKRLDKTVLPNYAYGYVIDDISKGYVMADSAASVKTMVYSMDGVFGDGITNSTTTDLLKWDQALYTEKLVSKSTMEEAFSPALLNNGKTFGYGFGWMIKNTNEFGKILMHSGGWPGYATWIERHPENNKTIIILANAGHAFDKVGTIRRLLYGKEISAFQEMKISKAKLQAFTGLYRLNSDSLKISLEKDTLWVEGTRQPKRFLLAEEGEQFSTEKRNYKIVFEKNEKGSVNALRITNDIGPDVWFRKDN